MPNTKYNSITPMVSLQPAKAVFYTKFVKSEKWSPSQYNRYQTKVESFPDPNIFDPNYTRTVTTTIQVEESNITKKNTTQLPSTNATNFKISHKANVNIKNRINWLFQLSKPKERMSTSGKAVHRFKISFITLTLPSKQVHPTAEITEKCLNQWLVEMRKNTLFQNYVWRLEFQKNGNVHYHIVTDTFIQWHHARNTWNRIINKLGYVNEYKSRFSPMNFTQYCAHTGVSSPKAYSIAKRRFDIGCSENWENPNTIDVKNVTSNDNISAYISKYVSKSSANQTSYNSLDTAENSKNIRLWFCSSSLSKLKAARFVVDTSAFDILDFIKKNAKTFHAAHEFCDVLFYEINRMTQELRIWLDTLFVQHSQKTNYIPSD